MHAQALVADVLPFRTPPPRTEYRPMTASPADVRDLESILRSVESSRDHAITKERRLSDALRRAITLVRGANESRSAVMWVLAALRQSMRRPSVAGGRWFVVDEDLYRWAIEQVDQLVGPLDGAQ